jgi:hypothetical protein
MPFEFNKKEQLIESFWMQKANGWEVHRKW